MPEETETTDLPSPTTSTKKSSKALALPPVPAVTHELVAAPPLISVVAPVMAVVPAVRSAFNNHPLKKILAMLEAGLVTVNVMAVMAADCMIPAKRAAVGEPVQVPGKGAEPG